MGEAAKHGDVLVEEAQRWVRRHPEALRLHAGKVVALNPRVGIVVTGSTLDEIAATHDLGKHSRDLLALDLREPSASVGRGHVRIVHLILSDLDASAPASAMHPAVARVWELARLASGWDGGEAPPPSGVACEFSRRVVERAVDEGFAPARVVADVEGGVVVYWFGPEALPGGSHRKVASIAVGNDGEPAGLTEDRSSEVREPFEVTFDALDAALARLRAFVEA